MKALGILLAVVLLALLTIVPASADPPPEAGIVVRYDDILAPAPQHCDLDAGLCAVYGIDPVELCGDPTYDDFDIVSWQLITLPQHEDVLRVVGQIHGKDVQAYVFPIELFSCATADAYIASGTVNFNLTDNDVYAVFAERNNNEAWGWMAQGNLEGSDGSKMHFNSNLRVTFKPDGSVENVVNKINLK